MSSQQWIHDIKNKSNRKKIATKKSGIKMYYEKKKLKIKKNDRIRGIQEARKKNIPVKKMWRKKWL